MKRYKLFFLTVALSCIFTCSLHAAVFYVDVNGSDYGGNGKSTPWKTIGFALTQADSGDLISINDGVYSEGQLVFPEGVSLTSTSQDNTKAKIQPNKYLGPNRPLLILSSVVPGSNGNQTISCVELDGQNGSNTCRWAIKVQNRNNVRIHHCNIHDFSKGSQSHAVWVKSTSVAFTCNWWNFWPGDAQEPGNDINLDALWPTNPITNFELDHNTITKCGYRESISSGIFSNTIELFNLKNSSIHDNYINSIDSKSECISGIAGLLDNVDIYNNTLRMAQYTDRSSYIIEIWNLRGGCEIFNNDANSCFSICYGKETKICNNDIVLDPPSRNGANLGIEFTLQTYGEVFGNYIEGAGIYGITTGITGRCQDANYIVKNTVIRNNTIYNVKGAGICISGMGADNANGRTNITEDIKVLNNIVDTNRSSAGYGLIRIEQADNGASGVARNIDVINNICLNAQTVPGATVGTVSNLVITNNLFWGSGTRNMWASGKAQNTVVADPEFRGPAGERDGYELTASSPALDVGVNVGLPFSGLNPDLGAIEFGTGGILPPLNVNAQ
jgi:hypothetical protein